MSKQTIEIDVPDGMQVGSERTLRAGGVTVWFVPEPPKTKWRPPTKLDLLGVDSIPARVRDALHDDWMERTITAVASDGDLKYGTSHCFWRYAKIEVPIDEEPPREAWVRYYKDYPDPWNLAYGTDRAADCEGTEIIHMIELREPKKGTQ